MKKVTKNLEETQNLGESLARDAKRGDVFLLFGELGSGKTSFVQGFAKGLGIKKRITSPTFVIMRNYSISKDSNFNHLDLYRLSGSNQLEEAGVAEAINDPSSISAVEWAERLETLPEKGYRVSFKYLGEDEREINIEEINGKN